MYEQRNIKVSVNGFNEFRINSWNKDLSIKEKKGSIYSEMRKEILELEKMYTEKKEIFEILINHYKQDKLEYVVKFSDINILNIIETSGSATGLSSYIINFNFKTEEKELI